MSQNLYDIANELERALRQSEPFLKLKKAMEAIEANEETKKQFEEFKAMTMKFQQMQLSGQQPSEEEIKEAQDIAQKAQEIDAIKELMIAEQGTSILIDDLNRIITKPLFELYN